MLSLNSLMIGTGNFEEMCAFYEKLTGKEPDWSDENYKGWLIGASFLTIGRHSEVNGSSKEPQRILINFETKEVKAEFDRLVGIGAKVIKEPYAMDGASDPQIATLADPDGNYIQLLVPWEE